MFKHCHNNSSQHEMVEELVELFKRMTLDPGQLSPPSRPPSRTRCRGGKPGAAPEAEGDCGERLQDRGGRGGACAPLPYRPHSALSPPGEPTVSTPPRVGHFSHAMIEDALSLCRKEPKCKILIKLGIEFGVPFFLSPIIRKKKKINIWFDKKRLRSHWNVNEANVLAVARRGFEKIKSILKISSQDLIRMNLQPLKRERLSRKKTYLPITHLHNINKKLGCITKKELFEARMAEISTEESNFQAYETKNLPLKHTCRMFNILTRECQNIRKEAKKHDVYKKVQTEDYQVFTCLNCKYEIKIEITLSDSEKHSLRQKFVKHLSVYNFCTRIKLGCHTCETCQTYSKKDEETIKKVQKLMTELNNIDDSIYDACHEAMLIETLKEDYEVNVKNLAATLRNRFPDAKIPRLNKPDLLLILKEVSTSKIDSDSSLEAFIKNLFWKRKLHRNRMNFFDKEIRKDIDSKGQALLKFQSMDEWRDWKIWNYQKNQDDIEFAISQRQKLHEKFFKDFEIETKLKKELNILNTIVTDWRKAKLIYDQRFGPKGNKVVADGSFLTVQNKIWEMIQETNRLKPNRNVQPQGVGLHLFRPLLLDPPKPGQPPPRGIQYHTAHYDVVKLNKGVQQISYFSTRTEESLQKEYLEKKIAIKRRLEYKNKSKLILPSEAKKIRKLQYFVSQLLSKRKREKDKFNKFVESFKSSIDWDSSYPSKDRKTLFSDFAKGKAEHTKDMKKTKKKLQEVRKKISKIKSPQLQEQERGKKWPTTIDTFEENHASFTFLPSVKEQPEIKTVQDLQSAGEALVKAQNSATFKQVPIKRHYKRIVNLNGPDLDNWEQGKLYCAHYRILSTVSLYEYF